MRLLRPSPRRCRPRAALPLPLLLLVLLLLLPGLGGCLGPSGTPPATVERVDLARYAGEWFEIARFPNFFQDGTDSCTATRAVYTPNADGTVGVVNSCRGDNGRLRRVEGWARAVSPENSRLRVTFFWPFFGDYWVIGLDPDYRWAVVGTPGRDYLWILARSPDLAPAAYAEALAIARREGFPVERLQRTAHPAE